MKGTPKNRSILFYKTNLHENELPKQQNIHVI